MHDIGDALVRAGLTEPVLDVERLTLTYKDVLALMRDLKIIGAHNMTEGRPRGLTGRGALRRVEAAYDRIGMDPKRARNERGGERVLERKLARNVDRDLGAIYGEVAALVVCSKGRVLSE